VTRVRVAALSAAALGGALLLSGCGSGQISQTAGMQPAVPGANSTVAPTADNSIQLRNVTLAYPGVDGYRQGANAPLLLHIFNTGQQPVTLVRVQTDAASAVTLSGGPVPSGHASPSPGGTAAPRETVSPFASPSETPSVSPSESPSGSPTSSPSGSPTSSPSGSPTETPSASPSESLPASPGGRPVNVTVPVAGFVALSSGAGATLQLEGLTRAIRAGESATITFVFSNGAQYTLDVPVGLPSVPAPRGSAAAEEGGGE
jgi:copper(I)-binding protein